MMLRASLFGVLTLSLFEPRSHLPWNRCPVAHDPSAKDVDNVGCDSPAADV